MLTIIEALDDPALFGGLFAGASWQPWRAFLAALFGLPLSEDQADTYRALHGPQVSLPLVAFVEAALIVGRRGGKSRVLALIAGVPGCLQRLHAVPGTGRGGNVGRALPANRQQARTIFRYVSGLLRANTLLKALIEDEANGSDHHFPIAS